MKTNASTLYLGPFGLCFMLVAGSNLSSADEAAGPTSAMSPTPNMACIPIHEKQEPPPLKKWNDCVGTFTYPDRNVYRGRFRHGQRDGLGVLEINYRGPSTSGMIGWDRPAIYVGNFSHDQLNGYGLLIVSSGIVYAGTFLSNILETEITAVGCVGGISAAWTNCVGMYRFPNGNIYRGEFADGLPGGIGMLQVKAIGTPETAQVRLPSPGVYIGQFKDGKLSGQGVVVMKGAGYFGTFRDNMLEPARVGKSDS